MCAALAAAIRRKAHAIMFFRPSRLKQRITSLYGFADFDFR
jgi:hypothetical protein